MGVVMIMVWDWSRSPALITWICQPGISRPLHWTADGLPVGMQFVAPYGGGDVLLSLANELEQACTWARRRPRISA